MDGSLKEDMPDSFDYPDVIFEDLLPEASDFASIYEKYILEDNLESVDMNELIEKSQDSSDDNISRYLEFASNFDEYQDV